MGEAFRDDAALRLLLQRVVADRLRRAHAFLDIARLDAVAVARRPDARIAVRLKFQPDRSGIALRLAGALLDRRHLLGRTGQVLDMVADLMRDDIGLGEVARRAEALAELLEEAGVEVHALVRRAVEGPHCGLGRTAARRRIALVEVDRGRAVGGALFLEDPAPGLLGRGHHPAREQLRLGIAGDVVAAAGDPALLHALATAAAQDTASAAHHQIADDHDRQDRKAAAAHPPAAEQQRQQTEQAEAAAPAPAASQVACVPCRIEIVETHRAIPVR